MWNFAQYGYQTTTSSGGTNAAVIIVYLIIVIALVAGLWKTFEKAGQAGWKAIIPIYNYVVMFRLVGMSGWYALLMLIPIVNLVVGIILFNKLAKSFGYGVGMTILLLLGIGFLVLGFGKAKFHGGDVAKAAPAQ